ncbi:uncharacterized protein LOC120642277 [Panicum virgatum]|uniref:Epidermal patterning factor-like protein n=1 Tax=Panicum virgatum TaxID=38727 RepID=A0A8T0QIC6_PANVG|nr:uncharacterized protein LOC120642277 [Panicum virgatum]KAG2572549.1 hypothetical protein PVAP13_7KG368900 [Panicum virgatum]
MMSTCTREYSSSRLRAPTTPTALVLVLLLLMGSPSWARVADGVIRTTTPRASPPAGGGGGVHGEAAAAPAAAAGSGRRTDGPEWTAASPSGEEEEEGGRPAADQREELPWAEARRAGAGAAGSRLPDCAHACGPCSPCRRVMVSFRCAQEASESCPVAHRCMCRGRFFRVPSL